MQARETTVKDLLTGTKVFLVPLFQRRYQWGSKQWEDLWEDVVGQYDHADVRDGLLPPGQGHFLGSVVLHPAPGPASTVSRFLVVDGQQRLTTLLAMLAAIRDLRASVDSSWDKGTYTNQYLSNPYSDEHRDRLVPTTFDQSSYLTTVRDGEPAGAIGNAYEWFRLQLLELSARDESSGGIDFARLDRAILLRLLLVEIDTHESDNVNNIFNTVNSKGLGLDPVDLVRNHIFMQMSPERAEETHRQYWLKLESRLSTGKRGGTSLKKFIWAYLVRSDSRATQKDLFSSFERQMGELTRGLAGVELEQVVVDELASLEVGSQLFLMADRPQSSATESLDPGVREALIDLSDWGVETHIPVTLEVLWRLHDGRADATQARAALLHVASFLVRRAVCGIPTNNLNRIFSGLVSQLDPNLPVDEAIARFLASGQRYWPTDEELFTKASNTPIYVTAKPSQVKFLLGKIEHFLWPKEPIDIENLEVEHVMPQTITRDWVEYLRDCGDEPNQTQTRLHTLGNLTLSGFNEKLSNSPFAKKVLTFSTSSLHLNQQIAESPRWDEATIVARAQQLATVIAEIFPRSEFGDGGEAAAGSVSRSREISEVLLRVPAGSWTSVEALMSLFAMTASEVEREVLGLSDLLAARVMTPDGDVPDFVSPDRLEQIKVQRDLAGADDAAGWAPGYEPHHVASDELALLAAGDGADDQEVE